MTDWNAVLAGHLGIDALAAETDVLRLLIDLGVQAVGAREGSILVFDAEQGDLVLTMTTAEGNAAQALLGRRLSLGTGLTGLAAATRQVQVGSPTYHFSDDEKEAGRTLPPDGTAVLAAPMLVGEDLAGVITAVSFDPDKRFRSRDAQLYASVASVAGVVVQQRRRITGLERISGGDPSASGEGNLDPAVTRVIRSVTRMAKAADWGRVSTLLAAMDALLDTDDAD